MLWYKFVCWFHDRVTCPIDHAIVKWTMNYEVKHNIPWEDEA